ncbi:MAG: hypothetical protein GY853_13395 [PVC group bacterium]|nr:hypothetical protein [PVC group bacterium]
MLTEEHKIDLAETLIKMRGSGETPERMQLLSDAYRQKYDVPQQGLAQPDVDVPEQPAPVAPISEEPPETIPFSYMGIPAQSFQGAGEYVEETAVDTGLKTVANINRNVHRLSSTAPKILQSVIKDSGHPLEKPVNDLVNRLDEYYNTNIEHIESQVKNKGAIDSNIIATLIGDVPFGVAEFAGGKMPWAAATAVAEGENPLTAMAKWYGLSKALHLANKFSVPIKTSAMSAIFGGQTAIEGGDYKDIIESTAVGGILANFGSSKRGIGAKDIYNKLTKRISSEKKPPAGQEKIKIGEFELTKEQAEKDITSEVEIEGKKMRRVDGKAKDLLKENEAKRSKYDALLKCLNAK